MCVENSFLGKSHSPVAGVCLVAILLVETEKQGKGLLILSQVVCEHQVQPGSFLSCLGR